MVYLNFIISKLLAAFFYHGVNRQLFSCKNFSNVSDRNLFFNWLNPSQMGICLPEFDKDLICVWFFLRFQLIHFQKRILIFFHQGLRRQFSLWIRVLVEYIAINVAYNCTILANIDKSVICCGFLLQTNSFFSKLPLHFLYRGLTKNFQNSIIPSGSKNYLGFRTSRRSLINW